MKNKLSYPFHDYLGAGLTIMRPTNADREAENRCKLTLKKIKENLIKDRYKKMQDFGNDVNEVWKYVFNNFKDNSILFISTKILSDWFKSKFDNRPRTETEKWIKDAQQLQIDLDNLIKSFDKK
ncbi:hypothetical protein TVAG_235170 [Trichomonas vaginalis G3]|uniref:Uncharacterized protein n=1 Tax=Trichomonas vaginalis (strain ATCC PRA-98 / G3) TaxID=412133 RepID=A2DPN5_TRIV3|nr:bromodomain family [Trichomonas vaginalis G3]EAY17635.1 hypothetical protein TVAG_235170 [Trichomonas vaginalis G3]KAI5486121.1 bromodomain family [Trichomonas vaginalis G3]|eukprot:XP_001329770.1 hypothetical protein [Trichomonas vaginalis G3]